MEKDGYFYIEQSEMFNFFRIPYALIREDYFKKMSLAAKLLYGLLLDRMSLSRENHWADANKRVYIIYRIEDIIKTMCVSRSKAINLLKELEEYGLVEKKRQGMNKPNLLYVKDFTMFVTETSGSVKSDTSEEKTSKETSDAEEEIFPEITSKTVEDEYKTSGSVKDDISGSVESDTSGNIKNHTPGSSEYEPLEVLELALNNHPEEKKTEKNHTDSNPILSEDANDMSGMTLNEVKALVQKNLDVDSLISEHPNDKALIEGMVNLITETLLINKPQLWVAKSLRDAKLVRERLLSLTASHIKYVMTCLEKNTSHVGSMKHYLLAALFNAPLTMEAANKVKYGQKDVPAYEQRPANRFINYTLGNYDFDAIERNERALRDKW